MKAVIFDMDGVIIDSEPLHFEVCLAVLKSIGFSQEKDYFNKFVGVTNPAMWKQVKEDLKILTTVEDLIKIQLDLTIKLFNESSMGAIDGIIDLMKELKKADILCAIGSSSPQVFIDAVIKKLGLNEYLKFALSGETLPKSKPDPMIFLKVAKDLEVEPKDCIVIEDSKHGVSAAKSAGMKCVGFINPNSGNQDLGKADLLVDDIKELSISYLRGIFQNISN